MQVYGYIRVSTRTQVISGLGLEVQERLIREFCEERGWELLEIFRDEGVSGAEVDRPGLSRLLETLNGVKDVVVANTSRLWREIYAQAIITKLLKEGCIRVHSVEDPRYDLYTNDPNAQLINAIMGAIDVWERSMITRKLYRARVQKARKGEKASGRAPYGYKWEGGKVVVSTEEAEIVRQVFRKYATGRYSISRLGKALGRPGSWVGHALRNSFYVGRLKWGEVDQAGSHEAIVPEQLFSEVQRVLDGRNTRRAAGV
jgi:site-specific DNA recombinase